MESGGDGSDSARLEAEDYELLIRRVREVVQAQVPADSMVAVVSKGDDGFVDIAGVRARHFPHDQQGVHTGTHPADAAEAIAQVEALRANEVEYLVLPSLAFWWLEHYPELNEHLMTRYQLLASEDACLVYRLVEQPPPVAVEESVPTPDPHVVPPIEDLLTNLLPARSAVATLTLSPGAKVPAGTQAWQFPRAARGDLAIAAGQIAALEAGGVEFLVVPRPEREWLELHPGLLHYLGSSHRLVTSQRHFGDVYELGAPVTNNDTEPETLEPPTEDWGLPGRSSVTRVLDMVFRSGADGGTR